MTELEHVVKHGGLAPKKLLQTISRRGFGACLLGGLAGSAASGVVSAASAGPATKSDFTIAIIPDPQYLAESCPDAFGGYYAGMMQWIVGNKNRALTSGGQSFNANIKAVVGVGDCVNSAAANEFANAQNAWAILDANGIAFASPPGNHDYAGGPAIRSNLGEQFKSGYFSATNRSSVYGQGIALGGGDMAYWIGSFDTTGANTAVKFVISGTKMLILAMDFFAGTAAWSWAYDVMIANSDCECYITTHAWLTTNGAQFQRIDTYGPNNYSMAASPYSNSAAEAWGTVGVNTWPNLVGIFSGHDLFTQQAEQAWYWQRTPVKSASARGQTVQQFFTNSQSLDGGCSASQNQATGSGQIASVFLLTRRHAQGRLEGRMISTHTGNWFGPRSASFPGGTNWSASETLLFSVPFPGLQRAGSATASH